MALIIPYKPHLADLIARELMALDILTILILIHKSYPRQEIESFIFKALTGEVLDKKAKKQIEAMLGS
ncbi:MAG TPA: hypothetical protein GXX46_01635 [Peptococcaceae bacterium]|nr:hypothetical protein [Peptococcaceae bacterium]